MYEIKWTPEKVEKAIAMLTKYFETYGIGECIMQGDDAIIEAPILLANMADDVLGEGIVYIEEIN